MPHHLERSEKFDGESVFMWASKVSNMIHGAENIIPQSYIYVLSVYL